MKFSNLLSDDAVTVEIGRRIAADRVRRGMTQAQFAASAGVSKRTVERLEDGGSAQLANLIKCLRALGKVERLESLLPEEPANPIDLLKRRNTPRERVRAAKAVPHSNAGLAESPPPKAPWKWGDET